jgi:hypothetical protein
VSAKILFENFFPKISIFTKNSLSRSPSVLRTIWFYNCVVTYPPAVLGGQHFSDKFFCGKLQGGPKNVV